MTLEKIVNKISSLKSKLAIVSLASVLALSTRAFSTLADQNWWNKYSQLNKPTVESYYQTFHDISLEPVVDFGVDLNYSLVPVTVVTESNSKVESNSSKQGVESKSEINAGISVGDKSNFGVGVSNTITYQDYSENKKEQGKIQSVTTSKYNLNFVLESKKNTEKPVGLESVIVNIFYVHDFERIPLKTILVKPFLNSSQIISTNLNLTKSQYKDIISNHDLSFEIEPVYKDDSLNKIRTELETMNEVKIFKNGEFEKEIYFINGISSNNILKSLDLNEKSNITVYPKYPSNELLEDQKLIIIERSAQSLNQLLENLIGENKYNSTWRTNQGTKYVETKWNARDGCSKIIVYSQDNQFGVKEKEFNLEESAWFWWFIFPYKSNFLVSDNVIDIQDYEHDLYIAARMYNKVSQTYKDYLYQLDYEHGLKEIGSFDNISGLGVSAKPFPLGLLIEMNSNNNSLKYIVYNPDNNSVINIGTFKTSF